MNDEQRDNIDDEFARLVAEMGDEATPKRVAVAVVMTPFESAEAVAAMCAMAKIAAHVVATPTGAVVVTEMEIAAADDWDVAELLGGDPDGGEGTKVDEMARTLSRTNRAGVVLLVSELATDVGIEIGLSGHISARRYVRGEAEDDIPAGLVLAQADMIVEDLLLGRRRVHDIAEAVDTRGLGPGAAMRMLGRGRRRFFGK